MKEDKRLARAVERMPRLFTENLRLMDSYTKEAYLPTVKAFCDRYEAVLADYDAFCRENPQEAKEAAFLCAEAFLEGAAGVIEKSRQKKKLAASLDMQMYRQNLAAFIVPGIGAMNLAYGQALMDAVREGWNRAYPKYPFIQADVETLNKGFRMKWW
ncbi:MAG: hypothetical protein HFI93_09030 [Lachnospiraceae bacterium]|nr:hypothetical protein [Lachnospiraceae bacterium]